MLDRILHVLETLIFFILCAAFLGYSTPPTTDKIENIRAFTRNIEFNYVNWTLEAALLKLQAATVGVPYTLNSEIQKKIVSDYLHFTQLALEQEHQLEQLYADANILDKEAASASLRGTSHQHT